MHVLIVIFVFLQFSSCEARSANTLSNTIPNPDLFVVDLDNAEIKRSILYLSSLFKNARCIALENHIDGLVGDIDKLIVHDNLLYVLDKKFAKGLFVYNLDGKFIRRIGRFGRGPGEYSQLYDFTINTSQNEIIILDHETMLVYDIRGNFLRNVRLQQIDGHVNQLLYYDKLIYTTFMAYNANINNYLLQSLDVNSGQRQNFYLDVDRHNKGWNESMIFGMTSFAPKLCPPYFYRASFMDTIFSITNRGLMPYLTIKSRDLITNRDLRFPPNANRLMYFSQNYRNINKILGLSCFFESSENIYFQYHKGRDGISCVLFDKKTKTTQIFDTNIFQNDIIFVERLLHPTFLTFDDKGVYELYSGYRLDRLLEFIRDNKIKPPFIEQLQKLHEEPNPIIFYYEFKDAE